MLLSSSKVIFLQCHIHSRICLSNVHSQTVEGGGPRLVVSTFHARVRGSISGLCGLKETKMFLPHPRVKVSIMGSLRDRVVACSASDRQGSNFESSVWRTVSSQSSHHPQEVLLAQFSVYVHKGGLKPDSFHFTVGGSLAEIYAFILLCCKSVFIMFRKYAENTGIFIFEICFLKALYIDLSQLI